MHLYKINLCNFIIIFTGQVLYFQISLLEVLIQDLKKLEDTICQSYTYFKVLFSYYTIFNNIKLFHLNL